MLNNIVTLKSGLEVPQGHSTGTTRKLGYGFLFAFYSNYSRIFSVCEIYPASNNDVTLKSGLRFVQGVTHGIAIVQRASRSLAAIDTHAAIDSKLKTVGSCGIYRHVAHGL